MLWQFEYSKVIYNEGIFEYSEVIYNEGVESYNGGDVAVISIERPE
jgi:hypothetical protein